MTPRIGFAIALLIMGFQAGVEGDYMVYMEQFSLSHSGSTVDWRTIEDEPFFPFLVKFFPFNSTLLFTLFLVVFDLAVIVRFIGRYCPKQTQYLPAILFYFSVNMMLFQMKGLRQGLAIELMLLSFLILDGKKKWLSLIVVVLAFLTHNSAAVVVPFYIIYFIVLKRNHITDNSTGKQAKLDAMPYILVGIYMVVYYIRATVLYQYLAPLALLIGGGNRLSGYLDTSNTTTEGMDANFFDISPLIVLYNAVIIFLVAKYYGKADVKMRLFCAISIAAAFCDMIFFGMGALARISMYYVIFNLVVYPAVLCDIRKKYGKVWALVFMVFLVGYAMKTSLPWMLSTDGDRFGNYHFIFM